MPGEFRRSQNWIGGTRPGNARYVPPPHEYIADYMSNLEKFLHNPSSQLSPLIKAALMHVQFESIHPSDGNGRIGRLLIPLLLYDEGILSRPVLYLSLYFKSYR
ncbi:MAG: Fic family protein [Deinococcales bacterium]